MSELWKWSASDLADAVRSKRVSAVEVTKAHLARLADVNPAINAVVQEFPDEAIAEAEAVDSQVARGIDPGPLCGVPVTTKVNVDQKGHATTNGLKLQKDLIAQEDNPVVANLRRAGAIVVGRTNTPAFSLRWFTNNDLHGQTLNPRNAGLTPGGSSGGAAAAVAAGICAIGHGTDIAGSVRYPAYACGLHGLRPSLGRVAAFNATGGDRYIGAQIMAVSGPIARTIDDIELSLQSMAASDPNDTWFTPSPLKQQGYEKRVALATAPDGMTVADEVKTALTEAAQALVAAGWVVQEVSCPPLRPAADINATLWMAEMQFAAEGAVVKEGEADSMFVYEQMTKDAGTVDINDLMKALQARAGLVREWETFHAKYPVLLCPVSGMLPFPQQMDVKSEGDFATVFEAQVIQRALPTLGLPGLSVATGAIGRIPVGVQLIAGRYREDILLAAGKDIENAVGCPVASDPF
jgi:amidase